MRPRFWPLVVLSCLLLLVGATTWLSDVSAAPLIQEEAPIEHVVEAGETLFSIAQRYGTTVEAIAGANDIADPSRIAVGQRLIIPFTDDVGFEEEDAAPVKKDIDFGIYFVLPDDTLDVVAQRFDSTPQAVAALNGVANPTALPAGGKLRVPADYSGRLHRVTADETAPGLALRYDVSLWEFLILNDLSSPGALLPGQRVLVPGESATATLPLPFVTLDVGPVPVLQGHTVRVRAELASGAEVKGVFEDEVLKFAAEGDIHYALFGIHALADARDYTLSLLATDTVGDEVYVSRSVTVMDGGYEFEEIVLPPDRDALLDPVALAAERARLEEIEVVFSRERYWDGPFLRPMDTELTSVFGTRRKYQSPSYESYGYHAGTDFDGEIGSPVYAPASGVVVLAEPLYVRGNAVIVDHGWGVYSGFWHLSQIEVEIGQKVEPGDQIALVGHTGLSTGPHLHWDFWVNGTNVDALQWTEQVFP